MTLDDSTLAGVDSYWSGEHERLPARHAELIGHFITGCNIVETRCHIAIRELVGGEDELTRLLIGEPRISDLLTLIKLLAGHRGLDEPQLQQVNAVCTEVKYLFDVRGAVAHRAPDFRSIGFRFNSGVTIRDANSAKKYLYYCTLQELENLAEFARFISIQIGRAVGGWNPNELENERRKFRNEFPLPQSPNQQASTQSRL